MSNNMILLFGVVFALLVFSSISVFVIGILRGNWFDIVFGGYSAIVSLVNFIMNLDGWK